MKGIIFCTFIEMLESILPIEKVEELLEKSNLPSHGAYTSIGYYDHQEMISLVQNLSEMLDTPAADLQITFGKYLFNSLISKFPDFVVEDDTAFTFLSKVDQHIHMEVRKLYHDAELPEFKTSDPRQNHFTMTYHSQRPFAAVAEGLILACIEHFGTAVTLNKKELSKQTGTAVEFYMEVA